MLLITKPLFAILADCSRLNYAWVSNGDESRITNFAKICDWELFDVLIRHLAPALC